MISCSSSSITAWDSYLKKLAFGFCLKIDFFGFSFNFSSFYKGVRADSYLFFKASSLFLVAEEIFLFSFGASTSFLSSSPKTEELAEIESETSFVSTLVSFFPHGFYTTCFSVLALLDPPVPASKSSTGGPISLIIFIASSVASRTGFILSNQQWFKQLRISFLKGIITSFKIADKV